MWTSKLGHIRVKHNHWCSVWWILFNSWGCNRSTVSTLSQYTFPIGQLTFIISQWTNNRICCILATYMTSFIVWNSVVRKLFVSLSEFTFSSSTWIIYFIFHIFFFFRRHAFNDSWEYFELLQMAQPHIILWWSIIERSWGGGKKQSMVSLIITSFVSVCLSPS